MRQAIRYDNVYSVRFIYFIYLSPSDRPRSSGGLATLTCRDCV